VPVLTESPHDSDAPPGVESFFALWCGRLAYALLDVVVVVVQPLFTALLARGDELGLDLRRTSDLQRYRQLAENPEKIWVYYADTPPVVAN
jgi:hypothetical protein